MYPVRPTCREGEIGTQTEFEGSYSSKTDELRSLIEDARTKDQIPALCDRRWRDDWFTSTIVEDGNPLGSVDDKDLAIILLEEELGIGRQFRDRFPELVQIQKDNENGVFLKVTKKGQVGGDSSQESCTSIYKLCVGAASDGDLYDVFTSLKQMAVE